MKDKYIPQLTMGDTSRGQANSDKTHVDKTSFPCGKERQTPYVIRKLCVGEQRKEGEVKGEVEEEVEDMNMPLISTSKFHQVGLIVRGVLCLTVFAPRSG